MNHPAEDRLQDYVEDLLCREERAELEQHLVQCTTCTAHVRAGRELRGALRSLPRSIEPPEHLLADIHARIEAEAMPRRRRFPALAAPLAARTGPLAARTGPLAARTGPLAARTGPLAAAALVLLVTTALFTWYLQSQGGSDGTFADDAVGGVVGQVLAAERPYLAAAAELEVVLAGAGDQLTLETRALLQRNLQVIDRALAESRAALDGEPDNVVLAELLRAAHEQKLTLLRGATRATGGT